MEDDNLSNREVHIIEEYGVLKRVYEIQNLLITALIARCGGAVKLEHDEIEFARKNYVLTKEISSDDFTVGAKFSVRLK